MFICASLCTFYSNEMYNNEASYRTFIIKICMSNHIVFALSCHMTYIFKKWLSKNFNTNPSNSVPAHKVCKRRFDLFGVRDVLTKIKRWIFLFSMMSRVFIFVGCFRIFSLTQKQESMEKTRCLSVIITYAYVNVQKEFHMLMAHSHFFLL